MFLAQNFVVFGRLLRRLGLDVHTGRLLDLATALHHVNLGDRHEVYHACRTLLIHRHEDLATFDRAFEAFWRNPAAPLPRPPSAGLREQPAHQRGPSIAIERDADDSRNEDESTEPEPRELRTWSDVASLADKEDRKSVV